MSISGLFLVLFLMFHSLMNFVVIISADAYNTIAATLGANWYALIATGILALGFIFHIIYALILSLQNLKARGASRYAVSDSQKNVSWASKNMLVLGIIVLGFLALHLIHFWSKMQLVELMHGHNYAAAGYHDPTDGAYFIRELFTQPLYSSIYIVWLVALWYHLTHGFWSAMQTLGLNNKTWLPRIKKISYVLATIICLLFISVPVYYLLGFGA
jgi:succinate dehydrogenase / fumarate reductase cytochrome b subunit